jgi:hypothetical protein
MPTKSKIEAALKERIKRDDPDNFDPERWKKVRLGFTYGEDEELVDIAIYETTEELLNKEGRYMPDKVWRALVDEVNADKKAEDALVPMRDAASNARRLPVNDEGPLTGRPPVRPTLKRRQ